MTAMTAALDDRPAVQRWAYGLVLVATGVALGVSGAPAPLYGLYEQQWHLSPLTTTLVFAVYAVAALMAVLVSGRISDVVGRKPVLIGAFAVLVAGLAAFLLAESVPMLLLARALHGLGVGATVVAGRPPCSICARSTARARASSAASPSTSASPWRCSARRCWPSTPRTRCARPTW